MGLLTKARTNAEPSSFGKGLKKLASKATSQPAPGKSALPGNLENRNDAMDRDGGGAREHVLANKPVARDPVASAFSRQSAAQSLAISGAVFVDANGNINQAQVTSVALNRQIVQNIQNHHARNQEELERADSDRSSAQMGAAKNASIQQSKLGGHAVWGLSYQMPLSLDNIHNEWHAFTSLGVTPGMMKKLHDIWVEKKPSLAKLPSNEMWKAGRHIANRLCLSLSAENVHMGFQYHYDKSSGKHQVLAMPPLSRAQNDLAKIAHFNKYSGVPYHEPFNKNHLNNEVTEVDEDAPFPSYTKDMRMPLPAIDDAYFMFHELGVSPEMMKYWSDKVTKFVAMQREHHPGESFEKFEYIWERFSEMVNGAHREDAIPLTVRVEPRKFGAPGLELVWTPTLTRADTIAAVKILRAESERKKSAENI